jgi:DNA-binding PadR family transcriptional regulator
MSEANDSISDQIPLREPTFFILLSLAAGEKHGYAIMKDVAEISQGKVTLSTGTLYEALARLLDQTFIERIDRSEDDPDESEGRQSHPGRPRKVYRLTRRGRRVIEAETLRLQSLISVARQRLGGKATA